MPVMWLDPEHMKNFICVANAEGHSTWTYTSCLGVLLERAERLAGPRDPSWTILGVEFCGEEKKGAVPENKYPSDCRHVLIRLTLGTRQDPQRGFFQLAHEVCHLLSPIGKSNNPPNLEEGFATVFAERMALELVGYDYSTPIGDPYRQPRDDVLSLLEIDEFAIKAIRELQPQFSLVTPEIIAQAVPGAPVEVAARLCQVFTK